MRLTRVLQAALCVGLLGLTPAFGQFVLSSPTGAYTANTTLLSTPTGSGITSIAGGGQTASFSASLSGSLVGSLGGWTVWGAPPDTETATPNVLATAFFPVVTSMTVTLGSPANTFGFELEPANATTFPTPTAHSISVTFYSGGTPVQTITQAVTYNAARLFAVSSATPITSVQITAPSAAGGFAVGQFRSGNVLLNGAGVVAIPALGPAQLGALGLALAAAGALFARRQQTA